MAHQHAIVWIDQHEARIFRAADDGFSASTVEAPERHVHRHEQQTRERGHPADAHRYYHDVARALEDAEEILVVGPATAKLELLKHVHRHHHTLEPKIVGVETVDHPTDGQIIAYARRYFHAPAMR